MKLSLKKSIVLFLIVFLLGGFLRFYKLGQQSFIADEYLGADIAYGYLKTGNWVMWDFNQNQPTNEVYTRANIYYWQVAKVFNFLETNEQNGRLVSVFWGLIGILLIFFITYALFENPTLSLIAAAFLAVSISALTFDRNLRMYSMFAPIYFLLSFFVYKFLESKPPANSSLSIFRKIWQKTGLNWLYFLPAVLVGLVSLNTHLLTANIGITVFIYLLVMAVVTYQKEKSFKNKYIALIILSLAAFFSISRISVFHEALHYFSANVWAWSYLEKVTVDYSYGLLAATFLIIGAVYLIKKDRKAGLWVVLSFMVPLALAIYSWNRNAGDQYIYFTEPFKIIIIAAGIYFVAKFLGEKISLRKPTFVSWGLAIYLFIILINIPFFLSPDGFYGDLTSWSHPNYREIYGYYLKKRGPNDVLVSRKLPFFNIRGSKSNVLTYGDGNKLTLDMIRAAQEQYDRLWFIGIADSHISGDARNFIENDTQTIKTKYTNADTVIKIWDKSAQPNK